MSFNIMWSRIFWDFLGYVGFLVSSFALFTSEYLFVKIITGIFTVVIFFGTLWIKHRESFDDGFETAMALVEEEEGSVVFVKEGDEEDAHSS